MHEEFHQLEQILNQSRAVLNRAEWRAGIGVRRMPARFYNDLNVMKRENLQLARLLAEHQAKALQSGENLGFIAAALIGGAVVGATGLIGWIWKNRAQSEDLEERTSLYKYMTEEEGVDPDKAAKLLFGSASSISEVLDKMAILAVIGIGAFALIKWTS